MKLFIFRAFTILWLTIVVWTAPLMVLKLYGTPRSEISTDALIINIFILIAAGLIGQVAIHFAMFDDWDIKKEKE